jgi:hypothetical protein
MRRHLPMIVVIGSPAAQLGDGSAHASGIAAAIARVAVRDGAAVQVVGRVGDDPTGDAVLLDLAAAGVDHVAMLRAAGTSTPLAAEPSPDVDDDASATAAVAVGGDGDAAPASGLPLDAADLELALRYLPDYRVIVVAPGLDPAAMATVVAAAAWSGARLVVLDDGGGSPESLPADATVLEQPPDADSAFAELVARYAVELDRGAEPAAAFAAASGESGWQPVEA